MQGNANAGGAAKQQVQKMSKVEILLFASYFTLILIVTEMQL
jgi:hypothetical protein